MSENNCKDCVQIENLKQQLNDLISFKNDFEKRLSELEKNTAVTEEQMKMSFKILNEIKASIDKIADKLDSIEKQAIKEDRIAELEKEIDTLKFEPAQKWKESVKLVATVVITAIATFIMSKILN